MERKIFPGVISQFGAKILIHRAYPLRGAFAGPLRFSASLDFLPLEKSDKGVRSGESTKEKKKPAAGVNRFNFHKLPALTSPLVKTFSKIAWEAGRGPFRGDNVN